MTKAQRKTGRELRVDISAIGDLRGALTVAGDIRSDIEFQNDVNALLAAVSRMTVDDPVKDGTRPSDRGTPTPVLAGRSRGRPRSATL